MECSISLTVSNIQASANAPSSRWLALHLPELALIQSVPRNLT